MAKFEMDTEFIRKLAKLLEETNLGEIEMADGRIPHSGAHGPAGTERDSWTTEFTNQEGNRPYVRNRRLYRKA